MMMVWNKYQLIKYKKTPRLFVVNDNILEHVVLEANGYTKQL